MNSAAMPSAIGAVAHTPSSAKKRGRIRMLPRKQTPLRKMVRKMVFRGRPVAWKKFEPMQKIGHSGKSRKNTRSPCAAIGTTSGSPLQNQPTTAGAKIITGMYRKSVMISLIRKAPLSVCATRRNCSAP